MPPRQGKAGRPRTGVERMERLAYRIPEAAETLGISRSKVYQLIDSGDLPAIRIGQTLRVPAEALRNWIRDQTKVGA